MCRLNGQASWMLPPPALENSRVGETPAGVSAGECPRDSPMLPPGKPRLDPVGLPACPRRGTTSTRQVYRLTAEKWLQFKTVTMPYGFGHPDHPLSVVLLQPMNLRAVSSVADCVAHFFPSWLACAYRTIRSGLIAGRGVLGGSMHAHADRGF